MREAYQLELTGNTDLLQTARAALENEYIKGDNSSSDILGELNKACQSCLANLKGTLKTLNSAILVVTRTVT